LIEGSRVKFAPEDNSYKQNLKKLKSNEERKMRH